MNKEARVKGLREASAKYKERLYRKRKKEFENEFKEKFPLYRKERASSPVKWDKD